jgi:hypothetical protein
MNYTMMHGFTNIKLPLNTFMAVQCADTGFEELKDIGV